MLNASLTAVASTAAARLAGSVAIAFGALRTEAEAWTPAAGAGTEVAAVAAKPATPTSGCSSAVGDSLGAADASGENLAALPGNGVACDQERMPEARNMRRRVCLCGHLSRWRIKHSSCKSTESCVVSQVNQGFVWAPAVLRLAPVLRPAC